VSDHYATCRSENCGVCGQLKGHCEHTKRKAVRKESRKDKLERRAYARARPYGREGLDDSRIAHDWLEGYKACMSDMRKISAKANLMGYRAEAFAAAAREFLKPMR
jgi:hypothetical protein